MTWILKSKTPPAATFAFDSGPGFDQGAMDGATHGACELACVEVDGLTAALMRWADATRTITVDFVGPGASEVVERLAKISGATRYINRIEVISDNAILDLSDFFGLEIPAVLS